MVIKKQEIDEEELNFSEFFNSTIDGLWETMEDVKEAAKSEDAELIKEKVKSLEEMVDKLKKIDLSVFSGMFFEIEACEYFAKALDGISSLCSNILSVFSNNQREISIKEILKLMFLIIEDVFVVSCNLNTTEKCVRDVSYFFSGF